MSSVNLASSLAKRKKAEVSDLTEKRALQQLALKRNEQESQIQAELARKDAEIERARMDAERKEAEKKQLLLQLEIERLKNQSTPPAASACCSVS